MTQSQQLEQILDQLVKDVESTVHAFYRGDQGQHTVQTRSDTHRKTARDALLANVRPDWRRAITAAREGTPVTGARVFKMAAV